MTHREIQDHYFRLAKREGFVSRAAYKLIEIDDRKHLLRKGDHVLDCGCAPGSWLQVAAKRVGTGGRVVGIDLKPVQAAARAANVRTVQGDIREAAAELLGADRPFDIVLSDLAPDTTGDRTMDHHQSVRLCHTVLDLCGHLLRAGGGVVMKVFEGEAYPELLARAREHFDRAKGFSPKASRNTSREMYVIGEGKKA